MPEEAKTETTAATATSHDEDDRKRAWPLWLAAGLTMVAAVAAVMSVASWQHAESSADDAEAQAAEHATQVDQLTADLQAGEQHIADTRTQVQAMRAILQPGTPEALQGIYLQLIQAGCANPDTDVETLITDVAADVAAGTTVLAGRTGWEAAIDRDAVTEALANCGTDDG